MLLQNTHDYQCNYCKYRRHDVPVAWPRMHIETKLDKYRFSNLRCRLENLYLTSFKEEKLYPVKMTTSERPALPITGGSDSGTEVPSRSPPHNSLISINLESFHARLIQLCAGAPPEVGDVGECLNVNVLHAY